MLKNLQEIMHGDAEHALVRLYSDELSEAEAAVIHNRAKADPKYRNELHGLFAVVAAIDRVAGDRSIEELASDYPRLLHARRTRQHLGLGLAAGLLLAIGTSLALFSPWTDDSHLDKYFTRIGEQRTIELADGSLVTLNTAGQLVVDYSGQTRRILLGRGEAFFEVAEDRERPFTVDLGTHAVTAIGTAFNVRKDPELYQVAVIEGVVAIHGAIEDLSAASPLVSADAATSGPHRVEAGWVAEFDVSRAKLTAFQPESMDRYLDWRSGLLSFDYEPLSQVVQELNRYSRRKIFIEDTSVMNWPVYTAIHIQDIDTALAGLEQLLPIEVTRHYDRIVITASSADENKTTTGKDNNGRKP